MRSDRQTDRQIDILIKILCTPLRGEIKMSLYKWKDAKIEHAQKAGFE